MAADKTSPMMLQYYEIKSQYPGSILFYRVGDFYETYGDDATVASKVLGLVLTRKSCGGGNFTNMAGVPHHAVDIYLPDLKHVSPRLSRLCAGAPDYFDAASAAIREMCRQTGPAQYDENGMMQRGVIVRHLILPGCTVDSCRVLDFIAESLPEGTPVSLMRQYTPSPHCTVPGLDRRITDGEYSRVLSNFEALGLTGYTQEKDSADSAYTPPFDLTGV